MTKTFPISPIFDNNFNCTKAIVVNQGGTSSGKTYSLLQVLFCKAAEERNLVITVAGQDMPNLKVGAIRDFDTILDSSPFFSSLIASINKSDRIYTFRNGSKIEFKSYEDAQDAKNGKRDYLFLNEANGISYAIFEELQVRTTKQVFLDYNPTAPFWVHEKLLGREDVQLFISTFEHNPFLNENIRRKILSYKDTDPERWRVYGRGLTGKTEGVIFKNVHWVSEFPKHIQKFCYGMDFGFTNDPTTIVKCGVSDGELYAERLMYKYNMTTTLLHQEMKALKISPKIDIFADCADPKTIKELNILGWQIRGAGKGKGSIMHGINKLLSYPKINIVTCEFWKAEQISYIWGVDRKTGKPTNEPTDDFNHLWDSLRYGIQGIHKSKTAGTTYK
jgi:phage terminase large subunit